MLWLMVSLIFEGDVAGPPAMHDTSRVLGACFDGWSLSDSIYVLYAIEPDVGEGIPALLIPLEDSAMMELHIRQAFCAARKVLEHYTFSGSYVDWMDVFPKDELNSCGEMVISYIRSRYPEVMDYRCHSYRCNEEMGMYLRNFLMDDVKDYLNRAPKDSYGVPTNLAIVVLFYESIALRAEWEGLDFIKEGR